MTVTTNENHKQKADLYHMIQQRCDRPAYFWFNYQTKLNLKSPFTLNTIKEMITGTGLNRTVEMIVDQGEGREFGLALKIGAIDPQEWCDNN